MWLTRASITIGPLGWCKTPINPYFTFVNFSAATYSGTCIIWENISKKEYKQILQNNSISSALITVFSTTTTLNTQQNCIVLIYNNRKKEPQANDMTTPIPLIYYLLIYLYKCYTSAYI